MRMSIPTLTTLGFRQLVHANKATRIFASSKECMLQQVATLNVNAWVTILFNLDFQWAFTVC